MSEGWKLELPGYGITFEADRLRRDRQELIGELLVKCERPNAQSVNGYLSVGDFNFSSVRARQDRAKLLAQRARSNGDVDWFGLLEEFCHGVFNAEREGDPAVDLRTLPQPKAGDDIRVDGLVFPRRHASILFGDGGSFKSYTALYIGGRLANNGTPVALFDWELAGDDHRERLERLFGAQMPVIHYCRCERPLTSEVDRLHRVIRDHKIQYAIFDSIAFACDGPPEAAEVAGRYFRALRQLDCGSLHVAHITKANEDNDQRPFGSAFWHNGARSTWYVKAVEAQPDSPHRQLGFYNRKANLGPFRGPAAYSVEFTDDRTIFEPADVADSPDLAAKLSVKQRMYRALKRGSLKFEDLAETIDADEDTIRRTARRYRNEFVLLSDGRVGLHMRFA